MSNIASHAGDLYFEVHGAGPPLLMVSGLGGLASFWSRHIERLSRSFSVAVYDHRGAGRSARSAPPYSMDQMANDAIAILDHLGWTRANFIGHSTGGAIGQILASRWPQRIERLVLSATWTHADAYFRRLFSARRDTLLRGGLELYNRWSMLLAHSPEWIEQNDKDPALSESKGASGSDPATIASKIEALLAFDGRAALASIRCPTLVVCAADDMITPAYFSRALARDIAGAELVILESGGHYAPVTQSDRFDACIRPFIERS